MLWPKSSTKIKVMKTIILNWIIMIDWLVHLYPPITRKRRCAIFWTNPHPLRSWPFSKLSCWHFDFFPRKFVACSKPPSRDNYRKASYPRTHQRDQGAGWTHDPAIRVVVKTTTLPIRPRWIATGRSPVDRRKNNCLHLRNKTEVQTRVKARVSNRTWTRTVNPNEPFHFGEPEPNLNQQNFTSVNLNQTWTLKIVLKWTQTEPEPPTKVRIYFSRSGCRWRWYTHNKSSGDYQQDQQFLLFFF